MKDGLSTDKTVAIAEEYADLVVSGKDVSIGDARNQGVEHAKVAFSSSSTLTQRCARRSKSQGETQR